MLFGSSFFVMLRSTFACGVCVSNASCNQVTRPSPAEECVRCDRLGRQFCKPCFDSWSFHFVQQFNLHIHAQCGDILQDACMCVALQVDVARAVSKALPAAKKSKRKVKHPLPTGVELDIDGKAPWAHLLDLAGPQLMNVGASVDSPHNVTPGH